MQDFKSLDLPEIIIESLKNMNFLTPTPIQSQAIPAALTGKDILGSAQTGTGKTGAYGIPLIAHLINNPDQSAIVLAPTRELAFQILTTLKQILGYKSKINSALIIGGESITGQIFKLKAKPRIIVGTPGRIYDMLNREAFKLDTFKFMVLDEIDRMLDMGFSIDLKKIVKFLPEQRQTLMFSATISPDIVKVAYTYSPDPLRISIGSTTTPIDKIKQELIKISSDSEKYSTLLTHLNDMAGLLIIFVKTKSATENLAIKLSNHGHSVGVIHGDLRQRVRAQAIKDFRNGKNRILVATDIVARGLDVPDIECVINYDLPQCPEDYIHRIGRTARAGTEGRAINFLTSSDNVKWRNICKMMDPNQKFEGSRSFENVSKSSRKNSNSKFSKFAKYSKNDRLEERAKFSKTNQPSRSFGFNKDSKIETKTSYPQDKSTSKNFDSLRDRRSEGSFGQPSFNKREKDLGNKNIKARKVSSYSKYAKSFKN